jgi:hypothetical protein
MLLLLLLLLLLCKRRARWLLADSAASLGVLYTAGTSVWQRRCILHCVQWAADCHSAGHLHQLHQQLWQQQQLQRLHHLEQPRAVECDCNSCLL